MYVCALKMLKLDREGGHGAAFAPLRGDTAGPVWSESPTWPVPLRRGHPRAPEDRGVGRPAALLGRRSRLPWIADARAVATRRAVLRIGWREREPQQWVKSAGGRWDPVRQVWILRRDVAERLDLLPRVVG